jgi:sortase A
MYRIAHLLQPRRPRDSRQHQIAARLFMAAGSVLVASWAFAQLDRIAASYSAVWSAAALQDDLHAASLQSLPAAFTTARVSAPWEPALAAGLARLAHFATPLAVLKISRLHLEVPVLDGTDDVTLNRGAGRIAGTARLGDAGNIGIAGHRDSFFRPLQHVRVGDAIELVGKGQSATYVVEWLRITDPNDISVLDSGAESSITLITCYPFHFLGPAPKRYIVRASLKSAPQLGPSSRRGSPVAIGPKKAGRSMVPFT